MTEAPQVGTIEAQIAALEKHVAEYQFNDQMIEAADTLLSYAFHPQAQGSRSVSEFFTGRRSPLSKREQSLSSPAHYVQLGKDRRVRRDEWATRVHATESSRAHFSREVITENDFTMSRVVRTVNELPERFIVYIRAEYMPQGPERSSYAGRLLVFFWRDYQEKITTGLDRAALFKMAEAVIAYSGEPGKYFANDLREALQISRPGWYKTYLPHWRAMLVEFHRLHRAALSSFLARY